MDERTCSWLCIVGLIKHGNSFRILRSQSEQKNIHILYRDNQLNYFGNIPYIALGAIENTI